MTTPQRSREACPNCGAHQLAVAQDEAPDLRQARPYDELLGMGDPVVHQPPGIVCLACGTEWDSLDDFRANRPV